MMAERRVLYLIDASSYVYRAFFALPSLSSPDGMPVNAVYGFTTMLLKLLRDTAPEYIGAVFDAPGPTFRDELFDDYKANRPPVPDELAAQIPVLREVVAAFRLRSLAVPGVEADDVIGTLARRVTAQRAETVIITGDKDLMQLVDGHVRLWDTMRDRWFDEAAVEARLGVPPEKVVDLIGLMGDPVDNIPGVKGIGQKTATALISRFGSMHALLGRLDELEGMKDIRGAKRLAGLLRENADLARLSRELAIVKRDVPLPCDFEEFRYPGPDQEALRALFTRFGFQSLLVRLLEAAPELCVSWRRAQAAEEVEAVCAGARGAGRVAVAADRSTEADDAHARGFVLCVADGSPVYVPLDQGPSAHDAVIELLRDKDVEKAAHDWKQDLLLLGDVPAHSVGPVFDTMLASYLLESTGSHRLEELASEVLGVHLPHFRDTEQSLADGVSLLERLRDRLAPQLAERGVERLFYEVEMPLVGILAEMERRGLRLDVDALERMGREMQAQMERLMTDIHELAGGEFNIASPAQLREVLFERLGLSRRGVRRGKTGLSTDVDVLTRLAREHPLPGKILEYRVLAKLKSTYVDALPAAVNRRSGRLHTSFNQAVTATGRLSSSAPNLQNIPVRGEEGQRIRAAFVAEEGSVLLCADYSQIELRLLAHLSEDPVLVDAFRSGEDVHARTASEVFGVLPGAVTTEMRRAAKVINFGIVYGMGPQRLARELAIGLRDAEEYIANYFRRYAGVDAYLQRVRREARECGYVTTLLGRRRTLPDLSSRDRATAQAAERTAINTPVQGSAADVIKVAMVSIDGRLRAEKAGAIMVLQVHDELVFEVVREHVDKVGGIVRHEMEQVYPLRVPLRVDMGTGRSWAEADAAKHS
jgi:DNA polymerase-1